MNFRFFAFFLVLGVAIASWFLTCAAWQFDQVRLGVVPLDPKSYERLTLVAVGTGGAYENPNRAGPSLAVARGDEIVLIDAGRDTTAALRACEIPVSQPGTVYLTNLMPEHTVGLADLLLTGWLEGREVPLRVLGPPGTKALAEGLLAAHAPAIRAQIEALGLPPDGARIEARDLAPGVVETPGEIAVRAEELPGGPLPTLGYRLESGGKAIAVAPVGFGRDAILALGRGADVLVRDAGFVPDPETAEKIGLELSPARLQGERRLTTPIDEVGGVAEQAGVRTLVLVRLRPPPVYDFQITGIVDERFHGRIVIPDDGDEITP